MPSTTKPLGIRGGQRRRDHAGLAAVANAVVDALAEFGSSISNCQPRPSASGGPSAPRAAMEPNSAKLRRAWSKARCGYHMFDCNLAGQNPLVQGARAARRRCAGGLVGC